MEQQKTMAETPEGNKRDLKSEFPEVTDLVNKLRLAFGEEVKVIYFKAECIDGEHICIDRRMGYKIP